MLKSLTLNRQLSFILSEICRRRSIYLRESSLQCVTKCCYATQFYDRSKKIDSTGGDMTWILDSGAMLKAGDQEKSKKQKARR
ncbi:MAG: hypothetical protein KAY82_02140 [Hylemonella sp.]|nr:hypothetical protein [Hylemonella sp.]